MNSTLNKTESTAPARSNGQQRANYLTPFANIREDKDGYTLEAELPGVSKEGLELTVESGELVILGRRGAVLAGVEPVYRESRPLDFRRVFEVDPSIDASKISANLEQGVLTLHLPKSEALKPRKIAVS